MKAREVNGEKKIYSVSRIRKIQLLFAGHIVNVNSILGHKVNQAVPGNKPTNSLYPPIKFAITGMTECIRQELLYLQTQIKISVRFSY